MDRFTVVIKNWERYNPRKDIKHPTWFSISNRLLEDPDLFDFEPIELKAMLYLFCQASQKNSPKITINAVHAERVCSIKLKDLSRALERLEKVGVIEVPERARTQSERIRTDTSRDTTDRQTDKQTHVVFDFESIYRGYPRKAGKDAAFRRLRQRIKTQEDYDSFANAVRRYASKCSSERVESKFVMMFSTFVGSEGNERWLDFVDTPATSTYPTPVNTLPSPPNEQIEASEPPVSPEKLAMYREQLKRLAGQKEPA